MRPDRSLVSGRRSGYSGTPWSTSPTSLPSCRSSMYLCRRWGTNWWNSCRRLYTTTPSGLSQCPRSLWTGIPQRSAVRRSQKAELLVEVPTIVSFSSLQQRTAEATFQSRVVEVGGRGGLQGFSSGQNSTARFVEQKVDIAVPGGGLHDLPDHGGSSTSAVSRDGRVGRGVFGLFHQVKKSPKSPSSLSPRVPARSCSRDSGGSCGSARRGRVRRVLRVPRRFVQAGLGLSAPVLLLVRSPP